MTNRYFEDIAGGEVEEFPAFVVDRAEMLAFSEKWDRLPVHLDDKAARLRGFRGIIASGQYTLCIKQFFINQASWREAVVAAAGWDDVRFHRPVYAGDAISARIRCVDKIESRSKPGRGIVKFEVLLINQEGEVVLSLLDSVMMEMRNK